MSFKFYCFLFLQLFILISAYDLDDKKKRQLENLINKEMKLANMHTLGIVITNKTDTLYQNIFGESDAANTKTPFVIGSVSKSFTALATLKLNISLNNTLDKYDLGDYLDEDLLKDITVGELLNHTSGLDSFSPKRVTQRGTYSYSNYGFALLGKIIEKESKKNYADYIEENIFKPLNMNNTRAKYRDSIIDSYDNFLGARCKYTSLKKEMEQKDGFYIPAGFISTSVEDMGDYLRFYLNESNIEYISNMTVCNLEVFYNRFYGLGMMVTKRSDHIVYEHGGTTNSFRSYLSVYPDLDLGIFMVANTADILFKQSISQFFTDINDFLAYGLYNGVDGSLSFCAHFTFDIIFFILIGIPITYLVITSVRKIKRKKYTWFENTKGKIIFGVDVFVLCILPIIILIFCYGVNGDVTDVKDLLFVVIVICIALWLNFIVKIVYIILYKKYHWEKFEISDKMEPLTKSIEIGSMKN